MSDSISRADAIRWIKTECNPYGKPTLEFESGKRVIEHLEQMPSVEPRGYLISREDAIEAIKKEIQDFEANYMHGEDDEEYGHDIGFVAGLHTAKTFIRSLPSAEAEWIPCSERLPKEETDVLVTRTFLGCKDGSRGWNDHIPPKTYVEVAQYFDGEWTAFSDEYKVARSRHTDPIAWMPLPKPYREDGEAE